MKTVSTRKCYLILILSRIRIRLHQHLSVSEVGHGCVWWICHSFNLLSH